MERIYIYGNGSNESVAIHHTENGDIEITTQPSITACKPFVTSYKRENNIMSMSVGYDRQAVYDGECEGGNQKTTKRSMFSVLKRFEMLDTTVKMICDGFHTSIVLAGQGGLGKSETTRLAMVEHGLKEAESLQVPMTSGEYIKVSGATSPSELYSLLYTHRREGVIMFDDCDSVFKDETSCNILKAVLDTSPTRTVTWLSPYIESMGLPTTFDFSAKIVFISNREVKKIPQAVISRSMTLDLQFTQAEVIERIGQLAPVIFPEFAESEIQEIMDLIAENVGVISDLNLRTLIKIGRVFKSGCKDWKSVAIFTA